MDLRLLELFVSVAEEGSIHGGARRLLIAQPAVSKGLQRLERQVGTPLVLRSHHGVELTAAGTVLLSEARHIIDSIDRAVAAVRSAGRRERKITIGLIAGRVAAADLTPVIVSAYRRSHPEVQVCLRELSFPDQFEAVATGDVDVALVRPPTAHDGLEIDVLFDEPLVLCCNEDHPWAGSTGLNVEDVLDEPMLDMAGTPQVWTDFWHLSDLRGGPARTGSDPVATLAELQLAVTFGEVVTPLAASAWRLGLAHPTLRAVPLADAPRSEVAVATRRGEARPDIQEFVDCARQLSRTLIDQVPGARARV